MRSSRWWKAYAAQSDCSIIVRPVIATMLGFFARQRLLRELKVCGERSARLYALSTVIAANDLARRLKKTAGIRSGKEAFREALVLVSNILAEADHNFATCGPEVLDVLERYVNRNFRDEVAGSFHSLSESYAGHSRTA